MADEALERMKHFCARLSHDLNNYTGIIQGYLELLKMELEANPDGLEYVERIGQACGKISDKIRCFETFAGHRKVPLFPTDLAELTRQVIGDNQAVQLTVEAEASVVDAHPDSLKLALHEIVENAREAAGEETVHLHIYQQSGNVCLDVINGGAALDSQAMARAFDPYFTTRGKGRGLGLSRVHGILSVHNAEVEMVADAHPQTCLRVRFPTMSAGEE